jgi:excisionase family DNA binding protein
MVICGHSERNDTETNNFGGERMGDTIQYPRMATVKKAAEIYGLSPAFIRRLCRTGKVRYVATGHRWLVNLDSLARYFEEGDPVDSSQSVEGIRKVAR